VQRQQASLTTAIETSEWPLAGPADKSAPAQKSSPAPVTTTTRSCPSVTEENASRRPSQPCGVTAFLRRGWFQRDRHDTIRAGDQDGSVVSGHGDLGCPPASVPAFTAAR